MSNKLEIMQSKNRQILRYRIANTGLMVATFILGAGLLFAVAVQQIKPPAPESNIRVLSDNTTITTPKAVRLGEPFEYHSHGEKYIQAPAEERIQLICDVNGAENIATIANFTSTRNKGVFDDRRVTAISPSAKLVSSKECRLQFSIDYSVYQESASGQLHQITVREIINSNTFEFIAE